MAIMHLSVSCVPFSANSIAGIVLMVSVTDADGVHYTSLRTQNFGVRWIVDAGTEVPVKSIAVEEYRSASKLPEIPGLYAITVQSERFSWSPTNANISAFFINVKEDGNHGQTLYTVTDPSIALPKS